MHAPLSSAPHCPWQLVYSLPRGGHVWKTRHKICQVIRESGDNSIERIATESIATTERIASQRLVSPAKRALEPKALVTWFLVFCMLTLVIGATPHANSCSCIIIRNYNLNVFNRSAFFHFLFKCHVITTHPLLSSVRRLTHVAPSREWYCECCCNLRCCNLRRCTLIFLFGRTRLAV